MENKIIGSDRHTNKFNSLNYLFVIPNAISKLVYNLAAFSEVVIVLVFCKILFRKKSFQFTFWSPKKESEHLKYSNIKKCQ